MKIWKSPIDLDAINAFNNNTMVSYLGIEITEVGDDYMVGTMPVDHRTVQPMGILHGGASAVLAESLGSIAANLCVENPIKTPVVGLSIDVSHLKSARSGIVTGKVTPIKLGRRIQLWQIAITNEAGDLIAESRLTTYIKEV